MTAINTIRLSIIIPFYNVERFIARCLDSVYRQDIPEEEYEVICVDDCSPDDSISIVENYAENHPNLKIVRNNVNRKLGGARNAGMDVATGRYIWFIDSDDLIEDNVLGVLCSTAENEDLDVLHFNYENYPVKTPLHSIKTNELMAGPDLFFRKGIKWSRDLVTAWRKLYKRTFLTENRIAFAENIMYEDNDYAIMVFAKAYRVRHIDLVAYHYSINPDSITRTGYSTEHIKYWFDLCRRLLAIKAKLFEDKSDIRFQKTIDIFVRNEVNHIFEVYQSLNRDQKKAARSIMNKNLRKPFNSYLSRSKYYRFKLWMA